MLDIRPVIRPILLERASLLRDCSGQTCKVQSSHRDSLMARRAVVAGHTHGSGDVMR
jgi:hypothetical protein